MVSADLIIDSDGVFSDTIKIMGNETMEVRSAKVEFRGKIDHSFGNAKLTTTLEGGSKLTFQADAVIDNNMTDGVNARPMLFRGSGTADTIAHDAAFDADHTGFDTSKTYEEQVWSADQWHAEGFSSAYYSNLTLITNHSRNLASIHKRTPAGGDTTYTHHGLMFFYKTTESSRAIWHVQTNPHTYDGGFGWNIPLELFAHETITFTGVNHEAARVHFGSLSGVGERLTKRGAGNLVISGTQGYNEGSVIDIHEGGVVFNTDPGDSNAIEWHYKTTGEGQYLRVIVRQGGFAHFLKGDPVWDSHDMVYVPPVDRNRLLSLESYGEVLVGKGLLEVKTAAQFSSDARFVFEKVSDQTGLRAEADVELGGILEVRSHELATGSHTLISAGQSMTGEFSSVSLPEGCSVVYEEDRLIMVVESTNARKSMAVQDIMHKSARSTKHLNRSGIILSKPSPIHPDLPPSWDLRGRRIQSNCATLHPFR